MGDGPSFFCALKAAKNNNCLLSISKTNLIRRVAVAFEGGDKPHPYFDMKGG
jgi:hypothetical protein